MNLASMRRLLALICALQCSAENSTSASSSTMEGVGGVGCAAVAARLGWLRYSSKPARSMAATSGGAPTITREIALGAYTNVLGSPCSAVTGDMKAVCYYHGNTGDLYATCDAEKFQVNLAAAAAVYAPLISFYGGPTGSAASHLTTYFGFLSDLPLAAGQTQFG